MRELKLDKELQALLETLAAGYTVEERCIWCMTLISTPVQQVTTQLHEEYCPTRRARALLAQNGMPAKMWQVSFQHHRQSRPYDEPWNGSICVVKHALTYEEACQRIAEHIVYVGDRILVENSVQVREVATL